MITAIEMVLMAGRAHESTRKGINWFPTPKGWEKIEHKEKAVASKPSLQARYEIIISFARSYPSDLTRARVLRHEFHIK